MPVDKKKKKKILLALDGSDQSLTAVRYVSRVFSKQAEVVLFHVEAEIPEVLRDMDVDPAAAEAEYPFRALGVHHQPIINEFLGKARGILTLQRNIFVDKFKKNVYGRDQQGD